MIMGNKPKPSPYYGFDSTWYKFGSKQVCFVLMTSIIVTNIAEIKKMSQVFFKRFKDRSYKLNLKKDIDDDDDDEVNSRMMTQ